MDERGRGQRYGGLKAELTVKAEVRIPKFETSAMPTQTTADRPDHPMHPARHPHSTELFSCGMLTNLRGTTVARHIYGWILV